MARKTQSQRCWCF